VWSLLAVAVVLAVAAAGWRRWARARKKARRRGASPQRAVPVRRFDQMDEFLQRHACGCGARFRLAGESSRTAGARGLRVTRLVCPACGAEERVYFEVTRVFH